MSRTTTGLARRKQCGQCHTLVPVEALNEVGRCDACRDQLDLFPAPKPPTHGQQRGRAW